MYKLIVYLTSIIVIFLMPSIVFAEQAYVIRVIDGDTIIVKMLNKIEHIRLIGIDTPELHDSKSGVAQCYAHQARLELQKRINHKNVDIERDLTTKNRDIYGRYLRIVTINKKSLARILVENGFARVYTRSPASDLTTLLKLQENAKNYSRGLWGACKK